MEKELFEQIVMSVCKSEYKTKQVMDIVYGSLMYNKCNNNHLYRKELSCCPFCKPVIVSIPEPIVKNEALLNVIDEPEVQSNVFIERGKVSGLESMERLGEVDNLGDLEKYGYKFFNIIKID